MLGADVENNDASVYEYYSYDTLVRISQGDTEIENTYDGESRNIYRKTNGKAKLFVYDGNTVIYETGTGGDENARNVYGINLISRTVPGTTALYGYNGHGDVVNLTSEGTVVAAYYYDEFGNHADIENHAGVFAELFTDEESAGGDNPYRYAGYEYLENADLYDLNARYYDPDTARFLSPDPYYNLGNRVIGLYEISVPNAVSVMQANNIYAYCGNNPVIYIDENGEIFFLVTAAIGAVAGGVAGAIYSQVKYGEVRWQNVVIGAAIGGAVGATGGAAAAYITTGSAVASTAAVAVGVKLKIAGAMTTGYATFKAFKKVYGKAGDGKAWHHIVEQSASNIQKFGAEMIHNAKNIVKIPHGAGKLHNLISGHYSSVQDFTNGMTVRKWLSTQSFEKQLSYGLEVLTKYAKDIGITIEFVK